MFIDQTELETAIKNTENDDIDALCINTLLENGIFLSANKIGISKFTIKELANVGVDMLKMVNVDSFYQICDNTTELDYHINITAFFTIDDIDVFTKIYKRHKF